MCARKQIPLHWFFFVSVFIEHRTNFSLPLSNVRNCIIVYTVKGRKCVLAITAWQIRKYAIYESFPLSIVAMCARTYFSVMEFTSMFVYICLLADVVKFGTLCFNIMQLYVLPNCENLIKSLFMVYLGSFLLYNRRPKIAYMCLHFK